MTSSRQFTDCGTACRKAEHHVDTDPECVLHDRAVVRERLARLREEREPDDHDEEQPLDF